MTFEDLKKANESIKTMDIKGKEYAEVNQRIKAFRMLYPQGFIETQILSIEDGVCVMRAEVGFYDENGTRRVLGTGTAYEKEDSSYINKTSYIENCETSCIGRAIATGCAVGIDTSVASYEEVSNAILNQGDNAPWRPDPNRKATPKQIAVIKRAYTPEQMKDLLEKNHVSTPEDLPFSAVSDIVGKIMKVRN